MGTDWWEYQMHKQSNSLLAEHGWHAAVCFLLTHPAWGTVNFTSTIHSDCSLNCQGCLVALTGQHGLWNKGKWMKRAISPTEYIPCRKPGKQGMHWGSLWLGKNPSESLTSDTLGIALMFTVGQFVQLPSFVSFQLDSLSFAELWSVSCSFDVSRLG